MSIVIQHLQSFTHFDDHGEMFTKKNCSIVVENDGTIVKIEENKNLIASGTILDAKNLIGLPVFVDCHSHALFAGNRSHEFLMKCQGKSYLDIAKEGGGIPHTQTSTEQASDDELIGLVESRLKQFRLQGVAAIEIKTGYGLSHEEEIRHLKILQRIKSKYSGIKIWITYLGPHAVKAGADKAAYLHEIYNETLPHIAREKLCDFVDIFVDEGFFTKEDMEQYCRIALDLGLSVKAHIDEIKNLGGSEVAARYGIASVDHCRHTTAAQFRALSEAGVQVVMLPATSFYIEEGFVPMKIFREANIKPAISLDYNPGSQPSLSWPFLLHLGMKKMGMNDAELIYATTIAPLKALNENLSNWSFSVGKKCKLNLFRATSVAELAYRFGENLLERGLFYL